MPRSRRTFNIQLLATIICWRMPTAMDSRPKFGHRARCGTSLDRTPAAIPQSATAFVATGSWHGLCILFLWIPEAGASRRSAQQGVV